MAKAASKKAKMTASAKKEAKKAGTSTASIKKPSARASRLAAKKAVAKKSTQDEVSKRVSRKNSERRSGAKDHEAKSGRQLLELGLLLDCTGSMCSWIARAKKTLQEITENVVASCDGNLDVRVCFVGYRDHCDKQRFTIHPFSDDIAKVKGFISAVKADGGGDFPEDVVGGLRKCLDQSWTANSSK